MKRSTERILTTHTGSLPRPRDLTAMLEALDAGTAPDPAAFDARVRGAVADVVRRQVEAGVDIVNDGEQGKVGYSTYVRHRLTGFGGQSAVAMRADWADFPEAAARLGRSTAVSRPSCNGPIEWKDRTAVQKDVAILRAALDGVQPAEAFMTAASPGVIAHFLRNEHYPTREAYLARLVDIMKEEYDAIHRAGFVLQVDCPDLAMGRHLAFRRPLQCRVRQDRRGQRRGAQSRAPRHPARPPPPAPLLGQLRGAASPRHPAAGDPRRRAEGPTPGAVLRGRQSRATSTNGWCSRRSGCPTTG